MLKIATIQDQEQNLITPTVYIDGVEFENDNIDVYYSLYDQNGSWINNKQVLENLNFYLYVGDQVSIEKLSSVKASGDLKNNSIRRVKSFKKSIISPTPYLETSQFLITGSPNVTTFSDTTLTTVITTTTSTLVETPTVGVAITAFCANPNICGTKTIEPLSSSLAFEKNFFGNTTYSYVNKIKNLDLLNVTTVFQTSSLSSSTAESPFLTDLLVAHTPDKTANLGFVFDIQKFLETNSPLYNILKYNENYRRIILANSKINSEFTYFLKRNITKKQVEYAKISNPVVAYKIDNSRYEYYVGIVDDNKDILDKSYYDIKAFLNIYDFSTEFATREIRLKLRNYLSLLNSYKNLFVQYSRNKNIIDVNTFIFENDYETFIPQFESLINDLSPIFSAFNNRTVEEYISLFVSILHPLTTRLGLLEKLINSLNTLDNITRDLVSIVAPAEEFLRVKNQTSKNKSLVSTQKKETFLTYEKTFGDSGEDPSQADFDYDFDAFHGIEVISADTLQTRLAQPKEGIKFFTEVENKSRAFLEASKYFGNPTANTRTSKDYFTISFIDFFNENYNLISGLPTTDITIYNDLFSRLKEYNDFSFTFRRPESLFFQLSERGIHIKSLSNRSNASTNGLIKNTIFDSNRESSILSLKYITDTGIVNLYNFLDRTTFSDPLTINKKMAESGDTDLIQEASIFQNSTVFKGSGGATSNELPKFNINNSIETKGKNIILFENIYRCKNISSGDILDIFSLEPLSVNDIFTKKLRLFNKIYAVRKKNENTVAPKKTVYNTTADLNMNIPVNYLNRYTKSPVINASVDTL